jgi:hypothetical protein
MAVIVSFIFRILQSLVYAVFGKLFAAISSIPITYVQIVRIAMVALTPVIILGTILELAHVWFPGEMLCFFIIAMFYVIYGIYANKA